MTSAQWTVPVVLGLLAAGITWYAPEPQVPRPEGVEIRTHSPYVLVPRGDHNATLLRYNATDSRHGLGGILDVHSGQVRNGTFWHSGGWECVRDPPCTGDAVPVVLGPPEPDATTTGPTGNASDASADRTMPSLGPDHPTARITFYIFASSGHLLATNAPRSQWETYDLHSDFTAFHQQEWHLGPGTAPPGASAVPLREQAYAILNGTPVGGVRSTVLEEHRYDWLVGPLWMTARVEGLTAAAPDLRAV